MTVRHSGQARVFDSAGAAERERAAGGCTGVTRRIHAGRDEHEGDEAVRNVPYWTLLPLMVRISLSKLGLPNGMAMMGLMISATSAVTTARTHRR